MLRLSHPLMFPRLVRQGETTFKSHSDSNKSTDIYKLNWAPMDEAREYRWIQRNGNGPYTSDQTFYLMKYPGTMPKEYDDWVKGLLFAIPRHYLDEIRRTANMAVIEWGKERGFDTMIRDVCLEPAINYAYVSFRLLADCIYDPETNYFYRHANKIITSQALLYKFWSGQTGWGLIRAHARFDKITWLITGEKQDSKLIMGEKQNSNNETEEVRKFIKAIDKYEKQLKDQSVSISYTSSPGEYISADLTNVSNTDTLNLTISEKDLEFKGENKMGLELLRSQWINGRKNREPNINCGNLKSLAITEFLKNLIRTCHAKDKHKLHIIVSNDSKIEEYKDLRDQGILDTISTAATAIDVLKEQKGLVFSDRVRGAELVGGIKENLWYFAGFHTNNDVFLNYVSGIAQDKNLITDEKETDG